MLIKLITVSSQKRLIRHRKLGRQQPQKQPRHYINQGIIQQKNTDGDIKQYFTVDVLNSIAYAIEPNGNFVWIRYIAIEERKQESKNG